MHARFVLHDSTEENMRLVWSYVERHGRPVSYYTDKAGLFQTAPKTARYATDLARDERDPLPPTQIGRALKPPRKTGHFYLAENRTFLLGVDMRSGAVKMSTFLRSSSTGNAPVPERAGQFSLPSIPASSWRLACRALRVPNRRAFREKCGSSPCIRRTVPGSRSSYPSLKPGGLPRQPGSPGALAENIKAAPVAQRELLDKLASLAAGRRQFPQGFQIDLYVEVA